jgi:acetyl-CoA carboxylase carboxyl transferase subunit alpha
MTLFPNRSGGAHRDVSLMADNLRKGLVKQLRKLRSLDAETLRARRFDRLMSYGGT